MRFLQCFMGGWPPKGGLLVGILRFVFAAICVLLLVGLFLALILGSYFVDLQPSTIAGWFLAAAVAALAVCLVIVIVKALIDFLFRRPIPFLVLVIYALSVLILVVFFLSLLPNPMIPELSEIIESLLEWLNW